MAGEPSAESAAMNHYDDQVFANASTDPFFKARNEHAWRLRTIDKLTLQEIGDRLNVCRERARQMVYRASGGEPYPDPLKNAGKPR